MANDNVIGTSVESVTSRVVGSSNPVLKKFSSIGKAFQGVGCGFLAVILSFVLIWNSINGVQENSKIVGLLDITSAEQLKDQSGMLKIQGQANIVKPADLLLQHCNDAACNTASDNTVALNNNLYFKVQYQRYEVKKEIKTEYTTRTENGKEIEDKTEKAVYTEEWVTKTNNTVWAEFTLGNTQIIAQKADLIAETKQTTVENIKIPNLAEGLQNYGQNVSSKVGSMRAVVNYVPMANQTLLVVGEKAGNMIKAGNPFIISDKSDQELIKNLQDSENTQRVLWMAGAWLACFIGFSMIFAPLIELVDWIPLFGGAAKAAAGFIALVLATIIVLLGFAFIKFWYLFVILLLVVFGLTIFLIVKNVSKPKVEKATT